VSFEVEIGKNRIELYLDLCFLWKTKITGGLGRKSSSHPVVSRSTYLFYVKFIFKFGKQTFQRRKINVHF